MVKTTVNKGYVTQIIGPVLDIEFPDGILPPIYSAIKISYEIPPPAKAGGFLSVS